MHPRLSFLSLWFIVLYLLYLFICTPKFLQILPRLKKKKKKKERKEKKTKKSKKQMQKRILIFRIFPINKYSLI